MSTQLPYLETVIVWSSPDYVERLSPCICPFPWCPIASCLQPCEQENQYNIMYSDDTWQNWGQIIYELQEQSGFSKRCICPPSRRALNLTGENIYGEIHIKANKPFKCPFFGFSRPELQVNYREQYIGKIMENFQWYLFKCQYHEICCYDKNNALLYKIVAKLCQCSLLCMLPCEPFREIKYVIKSRHGEEVGEIIHIFGGFRRECCSKADTYGVKFPIYATVEEKVLLILATIFIDYQQFDNY